MAYWNQSSDTVPVRAAFYGQSGWWKVPLGWTVRCDENQQWWATSTDGKEYACKMNVDGSLVFQDLMKTLIG